MTELLADKERTIQRIMELRTKNGKRLGKVALNLAKVFLSEDANEFFK